MCATISPVPLRRVTFLVFVASLLLLGWNASVSGVASAYVDPIAHVQDQDEALYGSISLEMATHHHWMTPVFLARYELVKPPLLYWLESLGMRVFGMGRLSMRLPSIFASALTTAIAFLWVAEAGAGLLAALTAALLLVSTHLFWVLSRTGLTDALLTCFTALAMFALARDPQLSSRRGLWTFGLASGAAIMTKGIAGLFALLALAMFCVISRERPVWTRLLAAVAISAAVAAPWHLYELLRHTRWFWGEYVMGEIVTSSLASPVQSTNETHLVYYATRLVFLDAPLAVAGLAALLAMLKQTRTRVLLAWIAIVLAAAMAFDYRNTSYLLPIYPALAIATGTALPRKLAPWILAAAALLFTVKATHPSEPWGLPSAQEAPMPSEPLLDRYAALHRGNELILGDPDDQLYSACLNLPRVRYVYIDPNHQSAPADAPPAGPDFDYLGITVTATNFARLAEVEPQFAQRLRDWGLNNTGALATVIAAHSAAEAAALLRDHPAADFFVPGGWASTDSGVHEVSESVNGRELLLSREVIQRP